MGRRGDQGVRSVTETGRRPAPDELELTLFGPGYGESVVVHVGNDTWIVIDSCVGEDGVPVAIQYLRSLGLDPSKVVALIVATHWHDDHLGGMTRLVETCTGALFCCSGALYQKEFLAMADALERRHLSMGGSGVAEIHGVFSHLIEARRKPLFALANRIIFSDEACKVWSLSPDDQRYLQFLRQINRLLPGEGRRKSRALTRSPNDVSVVLWIGMEDAVVLAGADLERGGWAGILSNRERPSRKASVFKVSHHGSVDADHSGIWEQLLEPTPVAVLTPWRLASGSLPRKGDVERILGYTSEAYASAQVYPRRPRPGLGAVTRSIRESDWELRRVPRTDGWLRLRRSVGAQARWRVETFGTARHLRD